MLTLGVSGDEHVHAAPAPLQHLDYLVAGEAAGRCCPDSKDVVTCAEAPILIGESTQMRSTHPSIRSTLG